MHSRTAPCSAAATRCRRDGTTVDEFRRVRLQTYRVADAPGAFRSGPPTHAAHTPPAAFRGQGRVRPAPRAGCTAVGKSATLADPRGAPHVATPRFAARWQKVR